jgi:hypothetical protein
MAASPLGQLGDHSGNPDLTAGPAPAALGLPAIPCAPADMKPLLFTFVAGTSTESLP